MQRRAHHPLICLLPLAKNVRPQILLPARPVFDLLNQNSFGAWPRPEFEAYQRWQLELERVPGDFLGWRSNALLAHARADLGAFLSAAAQDLVYVPDPTTATNVVAVRLPATTDVGALSARQWADYRIEIPVYWWNDQPILHLAVQAYNTPADMDKLLGALEAMLPAVR